MDILLQQIGELSTFDSQQPHIGFGACRGETRLILQDRHLTEEIAGAELGQWCITASLAQDRDGAGLNDVHVRTRIAFAEDVLAGAELLEILVGVRHEAGRIRVGGTRSAKV